MDKWDKILSLSRKYCGKRRNCLLRAISSFPTMLSKAVCLWCVKMIFYRVKGQPFTLILSSLSVTKFNCKIVLNQESWNYQKTFTSLNFIFLFEYSSIDLTNGESDF